MAKTVLDAHVWHAFGELLPCCNGGGGVIRMAQGADLQPLDLVLTPAEQSGPGRIDAGEIAVEVGDAEQVF